MINVSQSKNSSWEIGSIVSVGFMKNLKVTAIRQEKDSMPDIYELISTKGVKYEFIPHNGLTKI